MDLNCATHAAAHILNFKSVTRGFSDHRAAMSNSLFEPELITSIDMFEGELCVVMKWKDHKELTWEPLTWYLCEDRVDDLIEYLGNGGDQTNIPSDWVGWSAWRSTGRQLLAPTPITKKRTHNLRTCLSVHT
jgi:hypothetical protein